MPHDSSAPGRRVLIVEDDTNLRVGLRDNLAAAGYDVTEASSAEEMDRSLAAARFDLLILDLMLPGEDGYSACRRLRKNGLTSPVLMLTARSLEEDLVRGFEAGAQDYLTKPYRVRELLARVAALVKRPGVESTDELSFGEFILDLRRHELRRRSGDPVDLTRTEFDLLAFMLRNRDRALTRDELLNAVWGRDVVVVPRTVDNFVSSLKKKLGWSAESAFAIHSLRGVGYRFELLP